MAKFRSIPRSRKMESYTGRLMIDTVRGVLRVRKWPRKRGKPTHPTTVFWNDWFKQANRLAKYADPMAQARAIEMTQGTPMYPRDVMLASMRGRLYAWIDETGWKWYPMAGIQDISDTLDMLAQAVGSVLVRATDRWRAPPPAAVGSVLTYQGDTASPLWVAPSGGLVQQELTESPIVADDTVSEYVLDVGAYLDVGLTFNDVDLAASDTIRIRFSTDGGVTYKSGSTDYLAMYLTATLESNAFDSKIGISDGAGATNHIGTVDLRLLQAPQMTYLAVVGIRPGSVAARGGYTTFAGPITHAKIYTQTGVNFKLGTIRALGTRVA